MELKILTSTQEEYEKMIKIAKENDIPTICVYKPADSLASVMWSTDDVKEVLSEVEKEEDLKLALEHIESTMKDNMISSGWKTMAILKPDMLEAITKDWEV